MPTQPTEVGPGIAQRAASSAGWLFARRLSANVIRLVAVAVLARHLSPAEFGIVALAQVLLQFATVVGEAGIGTYVVYDHGERREDRVRATFWLNLAVTTVQAALCLALLPVASLVFDEGQIVAVLAALIGVFFVRQLAIVPEALVQRDLRHRVLARRDIALDVVTAAASVALAVGGAGVWSLVLPSVVVEPVRVAIAFGCARWRPRLPLGTGEWRRILRYTAPLMGSNVLLPIMNDGDTLVVGKVLGTTAVGHYNVAWQLSNLIGRNVTAVVSSVTMPALALLRDDPDRLRAAYLRMVRFLGLTCFPLLVGMAVVAGDLIPTVYGPRWEPAVDLLRIFVAFTLVRSVTSPSSMVYNVTGRPGIGFKVTAWFTPVYVVAVVVGSRWGAAGIATAVALVRITTALVDTHLAAGQIGLRLRAVVQTVQAAAALTAVMGAAVWLARQVLANNGVGPGGRLAASVALGAAVYGAGLLVLRPDGTDDLLRSVRAVRRRFRARARGPAGPPVTVAKEPV